MSTAEGENTSVVQKSIDLSPKSSCLASQDARNTWNDLPTSFKSRKSHGSYDSGKLLPEEIDSLEKKVDDYFDKKYYFKPPIGDWLLPKPDRMFVCHKWEDVSLLKMKRQLNIVKNKLNDFNLDDWHKHTRSTNKAGDVQWRLRQEFDPEFVTQAWCKFYENVMKFSLVPPAAVVSGFLSSVHLCEAPGAFITSLNHYLKLKNPAIVWHWLASTLNPYYEGNQLSNMINDDRFILKTLGNWNFGLDFTGNLMDLDNMLTIVSKAQGNGDVMLVTADGSIDCQEDPGEQESVVADLHFCEAVTALHTLAEGGSFLLKMFTMYEADSICLMYLLNCAFKKVAVNKPATSKEGNSEVYVVCLEYRGAAVMDPWLPVLRKFYGPKLGKNAMFELVSIPNDFLSQLKECAGQFTSYQIDVIESNIESYYRGLKPRDRHLARKCRYLVSNRFMETCKMSRLEESHEIVGKAKLNHTFTLNLDPRCECGSFNDKRRKAELPPLDLLRHLQAELEALGIDWPYGDQDIKWLMMPKMKPKYQIQTGKAVKRVNNSKFCVGKMLYIHNLVQDLATSEFALLPRGMCGNGGSGDCISSLAAELQEQFPGSIVLDFKSTLHSPTVTKDNGLAEREAFADIKEAVDHLWRDDTLILIGYPMLTQFNVGLIFMLTNLFEEVGFVRPRNRDFAIVLKHFRHWDANMRSFLDQVQEQMDAFHYSKNDTHVLAVLPIDFLCGETELETVSAVEITDDGTEVVFEHDARDFYTCVMNTNHLCLKEQTMDTLTFLLRPVTRLDPWTD